MKDLSVIILSYNTERLSRDCLRSLIKNTQNINYETIVVDNASSDSSPQMIKREFPNVKLITSKINLGFSKGNNLGVKKAEGRYLLFLNSDTVINNNALEKMVNYLNSHPKTAVIGPKLLNVDGTIQPSTGFFPNLDTVFKMLFLDHLFKGGLIRKAYSHTTSVDWIMGAALMIRKESFDLLTGFDENIFMYYDEVELCYRLKNKGFRADYYPEAQITHLWQGSSKTGRQGPILANYKGLLYFYGKHKSEFELFLLKIFLRKKAGLTYLVGLLTGNNYLKETYEKAWKLV